MAYFVLAAWIVQALVGIWLVVSWLRRGRPTATLFAHVGLVVVALALWIGFLVSSGVWLAWATFAILTVALTFGDVMLVRRSRLMAGGGTRSARDYGAAIAAVFRGRMPRRVTFHALFSPVVYFSCLGVCIGATIAAG